MQQTSQLYLPRQSSMGLRQFPLLLIQKPRLRVGQVLLLLLPHGQLLLLPLLLPPGQLPLLPLLPPLLLPPGRLLPLLQRPGRLLFLPLLLPPGQQLLPLQLIPCQLHLQCRNPQRKRQKNHSIRKRLMTVIFFSLVF